MGVHANLYVLLDKYTVLLSVNCDVLGAYYDEYGIYVMHDIWCVVEIILFDWLKYNLYTPIRFQVNISKKKRINNFG